MSKILSVTLKEGPCVFDESFKGPVSNEVHFPGPIRVLEEYRSSTNEGFIFLSLFRDVQSHAEMPTAEQCILDLLHRLCLVWHFAGGSTLRIYTELSSSVPRFETNRQQITEEFLANADKADVSAAASIMFHTAVKCRQLPLWRAKELLDLIDRDMYLEMMMQYYYKMNIHEHSWYVDAYKVSEVIHAMMIRDGITGADLNISNDELEKFRDVVHNYDHRHARINTDESRNQPASRSDIDDVRRMAFESIVKCIEHVERKRAAKC